MQGRQKMGIVKRILKDVIAIFRGAVYGCVSHVCKKENLWLFGAWGGKLYADNAKYLFEYIQENHKNIRAVWITKDHAVMQSVRDKGFEAYTVHSLKGMWMCMHGKVVFLTEGIHDISASLTAGAVRIQLWHGMGIKDVRSFLSQNESRIRQHYQKHIFSHNKSYWMTACQDAVNKYSEAYHVDPDRMYITGQPKDDMFVTECHHEMIQKIRQTHEGCKIVVYLPTHRNFGKQAAHAGVLSYESLLQVNEMLAERNIVMIFKPHMHEFKNYQDLDTNMSNIVFATDKEIYGDVYEFLPAADALLTDYSGIMLGYLTCKKPLIYFPYDFAEYANRDPGLYFPYEEVTAGPVCMTWAEVVEAMEKIFTEDEYVQQRVQLQQRFSPYCDGKNRERVYQKVMEITQSKTYIQE